MSSREVVIGEALRTLRIQAGYSVRGLAEKLGISHSTILDWEAERKTPRPAIAKRVAEVLGVPLGSFFVVLPRITESLSSGDSEINDVPA